MTEPVPPEVDPILQRWQTELSLILQELDLPPETEIAPVLKDDMVGFFLSPTDCVWLNIDGSVGRDRIEGDVHRLETIRAQVRFLGGS